MGFHDILETGRTPGEEGVSETIWDELAGAHDDELTIRDSAYTVQTGELEEAKALIMTLQAHNYTLMMQLEGDKVDEAETAADTEVEPFSGESPADSIWSVKE